MRDAIAEIVPSFKMLVSRPDYTLPYQVADKILDLPAEGWGVPDKCGNPRGEKCPRWTRDGKTTDECIFRVDAHDETVRDWCVHIKTRPATLQEVLDGKGVRV